MHSTSSSPTDVARPAATTQPAFRAQAVPSPELTVVIAAPFIDSVMPIVAVWLTLRFA